MQILGLMVVFLLFIVHTNAQSDAEMVEIEVEDITLRADYYPSTNDNAPAVLLLHMVDSDRKSWESLIPSLLEAGYAVLAPDLRGHGESEGTEDWQAAVSDVQLWLDWLGEQEETGDQVAVVGASIGGTLAILGCANEPSCTTVIALSAPFESRGLTIEAAVTEGLSERSLLAIATQGDEEFKIAAQQMLEISSGAVSVRLYDGSFHGTSMFLTRRLRDSLNKAVVSWLDEHFE